MEALKVVYIKERELVQSHRQKFLKLLLLLIFSDNLKVLSSKMDPAEIRLIQYVFIKERGTEGFYKNTPAPHPLRVLKVLERLVIF
jgi:hypothetical protein